MFKLKNSLFAGCSKIFSRPSIKSMGYVKRSSEEEVKLWSKQILAKQGLKSFAIDIEGTTEKGDGQLGDVTFVKVVKPYNLAVKNGKKSAKLREILPIRNCFINEISFFDKVLPTFLEFQRQRAIAKPFNNFPKCYGTLLTDEVEVLVLDNLYARKYSLHDRFQPMDKKHIEKVLETYGKLHGISYALRDQKPEVFHKVSSSLSDVLQLRRAAKNPDKNPDEKHTFHDMMVLAKKYQDRELSEKIIKLKEISLNHQLTDPKDAIVVHGDCWNNNFMFKYQDDQKTQIEDICLIDFQLSNLASPVHDLSYFLFTCMSPEDMGSFDGYVKYYHESLSDFTNLLGSDLKKLLPFDQLMEQWKRYSSFGLVMMPTAIRTCLTQEDEMLDLTEMAESGIEPRDEFFYTVKNIDEYERRTLPILKFAISKQFI